MAVPLLLMQVTRGSGGYGSSPLGAGGPWIATWHRAEVGKVIVFQGDEGEIVS